MTGSSIGLYLLLVIALAAGWAIARLTYQARNRNSPNVNHTYHDYFIGLNYLLRDEPDEAIDTFIRALEIKGETIETHLALGVLLRRRGKVDKAIQVHQTLLARPELDSDFADTVKLELSNNYIAAGLLDRSERLLNELLNDNNEAKWDALIQLITVYQTEKEWQNAIDTVSILLASSHFKKDKTFRSVAAHFCCELAELAIANEQFKEARGLIRKAFQFNRNSVRASFQLATIEQRSNNLHLAIKELVRIGQQHPVFLSEVIRPMADCYTLLGEGADNSEFENFLRTCLEEQPRASVLLQLAELKRQQDGDRAAAIMLANKLREKPSLKAMATLLQIHANETDGQLQDNLRLIRDGLQELIRSKPGYRCEQCGFEVKSLYWQCPGCQKWDSVKPILGIEGE